jgi:hypothetical protein
VQFSPKIKNKRPYYQTISLLGIDTKEMKLIPYRVICISVFIEGLFMIARI